MTDNVIDLSRYKGRTPGEWEARHYSGYSHILSTDGEELPVVVCEVHGVAHMRDYQQPNARLIADGPRILKRAQELEAEVERLRGEVAELTPAAENYQGLLEMYGVDWLQMWKFIDGLLSQRDELAGAIEALLKVSIPDDDATLEAIEQCAAALAKVRQKKEGGNDGTDND